MVHSNDMLPIADGDYNRLQLQKKRSRLGLNQEDVDSRYTQSEISKIETGDKNSKVARVKYFRLLDEHEKKRGKEYMLKHPEIIEDHDVFEMVLAKFSEIQAALWRGLSEHTTRGVGSSNYPA